MGAIANIVKQYVPASYAALVGATNSYYGPDELQALADFVQYRLFTTVADVADESTVYNPLQRQLLGVLTTLQFIPAAVDYWGDQLAATSTIGTNESDTYFDHRADLWKLFDHLTLEANALGNQVGVNIYAARGVIPKVSYGDNGRGILITQDPECFPPLHRWHHRAGESVDSSLIWSINP